MFYKSSRRDRTLLDCFYTRSIWYTDAATKSPHFSLLPHAYVRKTSRAIPLAVAIFPAREKHWSALFLCLRSYVRPARRWVLLLQPVEAVFYSPGTYFTLGDNKSRWTTLLERAEFNRVERNRYVRNVVKQGVALRRRIIAVLTCWWGTYEVRYVMVVRRKYRCHWVPSGRSLIPDNIFMGRITDCSDRNHEEVSRCINLYGKAGRILCENIAFEIYSYYGKIDDCDTFSSAYVKTQSFFILMALFMHDKHCLLF